MPLQRGEIIAEGFIQQGQIPSLKAVAAAERLFIPARMDESSLPLKITRLGGGLVRQLNAVDP